MTPSTLNLPADLLPHACEVLVVGAGPAGSACARTLAQAGVDVLLVDAHAFPRDKVCGDALVPDAHAALRRLDLHEQVMALAQPVATAQCVAPKGHSVDVAGEMAVLPREQLDLLLCTAAVDAGARMHAPLRFDGVLHDQDGRVCGATLMHGKQPHTVTAPWVILATGAHLPPLLAAGVCTRRTPSGMALRAHVQHPELARTLRSLRFTWHRQLQGGYGWIFPGPDATFNIGVGVLDNYVDKPSWWRPGARRRSGMNLRELFDAFLQVDPVAAQLMREGRVLRELKGAPLRCDLGGAQWSCPGLLVVGEAAGGTYSFTGEGIGKAMETGLAAADSLLAFGLGAGLTSSHGSHADHDAAVRAHYEATLSGLLPRYRSYRQAGGFNRHPWLADLVIRRAQHSPRIQAKLADVLNERRLPGGLFTWRALRNLMDG
jgi:geranylgeranyl reductase family protein